MRGESGRDRDVIQYHWNDGFIFTAEGAEHARVLKITAVALLSDLCVLCGEWLFGNLLWFNQNRDFRV